MITYNTMLKNAKTGKIQSAAEWLNEWNSLEEGVDDLNAFLGLSPVSNITDSIIVDPVACMLVNGVLKEVKV